MASIAEEERVKNHQRQAEGIISAKAKGVAFGRPSISKPENYELVMEQVTSGEITSVQAMKLLGVKKTSFYKLKKMYWSKN
jgi:DNA invertase Pin-like site-specific DNA recombinase